MRLGSGVLVSIDVLKQLFPSCRITHEIASGDSTDFTILRLLRRMESYSLFTIKSFLKDGERRSLDPSSHLLQHFP